MLDGDRIEAWPLALLAGEVLSRLEGQGPWPGAEPQRAAERTDDDVEYFHPVKFRLEPDLLVTVLGGLVYSGDIVLAITGDKIDSGKITLLADVDLDELKQFKHVEAPKEINVSVLRSCSNCWACHQVWPSSATQGSEETVKHCSKPSPNWSAAYLTAGTDLHGKLTFWGKPLLTDDEIRDWRTRLEALKTFTEGLTPYNTVGKLKNLRIGSDDIDAQKKNLEVLASVEKLLELVGDRLAAQRLTCRRPRWCCPATTRG